MDDGRATAAGTGGSELPIARRDSMIRIAKMYYVEGMSQQEIADTLKISRSGVSKTLKACKNLKLVEIRISESSSMDYMLSQEICGTFGLQEAVIVRTDPNPEVTRVELGRAAAKLLESRLRDGMRIGVAWGSSLYHMVSEFRPSRQLDVEVVQLLGGSGARDLNTDGFELARALAEKLGRKYSFFPAPLIVQNRSMKKALMQEREVELALKKTSGLDLAILGIGTNVSRTSALVRAGYISAEESDDLLRAGAVGDICGRHFDLRGLMEGFHLNERVIGIEPQQLLDIACRIGVAAGADKSEAILGALRGHWINVLVADEEAALRLLSLKNYTGEDRQGDGANHFPLKAK
jgi:DNA-binding transcriptional regulator LsrR (DeoR family)